MTQTRLKPKNPSCSYSPGIRTCQTSSKVKLGCTPIQCGKLSLKSSEVVLNCWTSALASGCSRKYRLLRLPTTSNPSRTRVCLFLTTLNRRSKTMRAPRTFPMTLSSTSRTSSLPAAALSRLSRKCCPCRRHRSSTTKFEDLMTPPRAILQTPSTI